MNRFKLIISLSIIGIVLSACHISPEWRREQSLSLMQSHAFETEPLPSEPYALFAAVPSDIPESNDELIIVIEGDGYAWVDDHTPSQDPTPSDPVGFRVAELTKNNNVVYLARPCQFVGIQNCQATQESWTSGRFSEEVIKSYLSAIDLLKEQYGSKEFIVMGYSGGAHIALALAYERDDVSAVMTVSGVVNPLLWSSYHEVTPLQPYKPIEELLEGSEKTMFFHFCSLGDEIVPCSLTNKFVTQAQQLGHRKHRYIQFDHGNHQEAWHNFVWKCALNTVRKKVKANRDQDKEDDAVN